MSIQLSHVTKTFGAHKVLDDVTLHVDDGELVALLGPSGGGKTTLLRILAGLEPPDSGRVLIDGRDVTQVPPRDRGVGLVFQHYALFKHLSVFENVAFALRVRGSLDEAVRDRVRNLLALMKLETLEGRRVDQLSGGQRQRVALARAMAADPQILLLDEPFGALDAQVRQELRRWLRKLHNDLPVTTLFVTHDQDEAFEVADRVVITHRGRVEQDDPPADVIDRPKNRFIAEFLGHTNVLFGRAAGGRARFGELEVDVPNLKEGEIVAYLRPQDVEILKSEERGASVARVASIRHSLASLKLELKVNGIEAPIEADVDRCIGGIRPGLEIFVRARRVVAFSA